MKTLSQIFLLLALLGLLSLTFSIEVSVSKSAGVSVALYTSNPEVSEGSAGASNNEEIGVETEEPSELPEADSFTACDPNNRPEACTKEYVPVCGYVRRCAGGNCTATFGNSCSACSHAAIEGYVNGTCEDVRAICDPKNRPEICTAIYTATCAVAANCHGVHCFENTSSSCVACSMKRVAYSLPGVCPGPDESGLREFCDDSNRPEICTADYNPVCAHQSNCVGRDCWGTAGNACSACANENIDFYIPGECADFANPYKGSINGGTRCNPNNRPEICTADFVPVCAHIRGCHINEEDCTRTEGNSCTACSHEDVDFYIEGECPS